MRYTQFAFEPLELRQLLAASDLLVNHYDAGSTGQTLTETVLTPTNVGSTQAGSSISTNFGRLFSTTLDGQVYAQPLAVSNVNITRGSSQGIHNVLYVATMHNSLYAIDQSTGAILWQDSFNNITDPTNLTATAGVRTVPAGGSNTTPTQPYNALVNGNDVGPELGIIATPTIDPATGILYVVVKTREMRTGATPNSSGADAHFVQRLWAVKSSDGTVAITPTGNPLTSVEPTTNGQIIGDTWKTDVTASSGTFSNYTNYKYIAGPYIKGSGNNTDTFNADGTVATTNNADGWIVNSNDTLTPWGVAGKTASQSGYIAFNALLQMNRVATTLINGQIYIGFASHGDDGPYYGWLLGYSAATLANTAAFITVPTFNSALKGSASFTSVGGLWGSGGAITTDGTYLYFTVGNGSFNPATTNFNSNYFSLDGTNHVLQPKDGNYGDSILKVAVDPNATQTNINLANDAAGNPTPSGAYSPELGYNQNGYGLKVVDYFTPSNVWELNLNDEDIGSGGVLLIPTTGPGAATAPNGDAMLVTAGKEGRVYLVDAGNMGGFNTQYIADGHQLTADSPAPYDRVLGEFYYYQWNGHSTTAANNQTNKGYEIPSYFNGTIYFGVSGAPELGITVSNLMFPAGPTTSRTAVYSTPSFNTVTPTPSRGATAAISGNGLTNNIVWNNWVAQNMTDASLTTALSNGQSGITTLAISPLATTSGFSNNTALRLQDPNSGNSQTVTVLNVPGTLTTALTNGQSAITTLNVTALAQTINSGSTITLRNSSGNSQSVTLSAQASSGATTISVNSFTSNAAYSIGSTIDTSGSGSFVFGATSLRVVIFTASAAFPVGTLITVNSQAQDALVAYSTSGTALFNSDWTISGQVNYLNDTLTNGVIGATGVKFSIPTVANGMVYVGTGGGSSSSNSRQLGTITGYGLLSSIVTLHQPVNANSTATSPTTIHVAWTRNSADTESGTKIERSLDGNTWTTIRIVHNGTTSFDDAGVSGGTKYFYRLTEVYASQSSAASTTFTVTTPPSLSSAVSRKVQGAFTGDLPLPLSGSPAIEPRVGGPTQIVLTFGQALDTSGLLSVNSTSGSGSASYLDNTHVSIALSGATDGQTLSLTLTGPRVTNGQAGSYTLNIGVLLGDIDGTSAVNVADVIAAKLSSGAAVDGSTYLVDLNADGAINVADVTTAKLNSGHNLGGGAQAAFVAGAVVSAVTPEAPAAESNATPALPADDQPVARLKESDSPVTTASAAATAIIDATPVEMTPTPSVAIASSEPMPVPVTIGVSDSAIESSEPLAIQHTGAEGVATSNPQDSIRAQLFADDFSLLETVCLVRSTKAKSPPAENSDDITLSDIPSLSV